MSDGIDILENRLLQLDPELLKTLLLDRTTGSNILWATESYADEGEGYAAHDPITIGAITGDHGRLIMPRVVKDRAVQMRRVREMAEVFTPSWLVNNMCNHLDEEWLSLPHLFSVPTSPTTWRATTAPIYIPKGRSWEEYVLSTRLEITCGEAPFLVSRYDTVTGTLIPIEQRIGLLDRKLRLVSERCDEHSWSRWALLALGSIYGYEWQGDNLLLAREAVLASFADHYERYFHREADLKLLHLAANIISWNLWQMDGLRGVVPGSCREEQHTSTDLFGEATTTITLCPGCQSDDLLRHNGRHCRLRRWLPSEGLQPSALDFRYTELIARKYKIHQNKRILMKFDYIIGNPPYQEETVGGQKTYMSPIYDQFMDAAFTVGRKVELITPARFLFDAGSTPAEWNRKMLSDKHFKVLFYEPDSSRIFSNTDIKGGVAITYRDKDRDLGAIRVFTGHETLNHILSKVLAKSSQFVSEIAVSRTAYRLTDKMHEENPSALGLLSKGHPYDMSTNIFDLLPFIFHDSKPSDGKDYIVIYGRQGNERVLKYVRRDYINDAPNLNSYKVILPSALGNGDYGETLTSPIIGGPGIGNTETFLSVGCFAREEEADSLLRYLSSKFARALLGVVKVTQHLTPSKFKYVPLQDFTAESDIDWAQDVHEIDLQLYRKYGLTADEQEFIESQVKEMR